MISVKVLKNVAHGIYDLRKGETIPLPESFAEQLREHGFVSYDDAAQGAGGDTTPEVKQAAPVDNKMLDAPYNKTQAVEALHTSDLP